MSDEYDYLFKAICVGDGGAGKTALVIRFSQGFFQEQYKLTIGVEFAVKTIELVNGKKVKLQIWDTGGQERFQHVRPLYYRGSMGAILLFDLTNRESFDHIPKWIEEVRTNAGEIPMLLVGNKSDLTDQRQVTRAEAEEFSKEFEMYYIESSAKDGSGVGDVFSILSCIMIGIEVPDVYLEGTILTDKNGKVMGTQPQFEKIEPIPELQELADIHVPKLKSETSKMEVEPQTPDFFSEKNLTKIEQPKQNVSVPSNEFPSNQFPSNQFPSEKFGTESFSRDDLADIPAPKSLDTDFAAQIQQNQVKATPKKLLSDKDLGIAPIPKRIDTQQKSVSETKSISIPNPISSSKPLSQKQQSESEEWDIPGSSSSGSSSIKIDNIASQQPSFSAPSLPSKEELDASIPAIPKRPAYLTSEGEGPITFDDSELDDFVEETPSKSSTPPPLIFETPDEIPDEELNSFSEPQPELQSKPIEQKPQEKQNAWSNFPEKPKAQPASPPPGFFPRNIPSPETVKKFPTEVAKEPVKETSSSSNPIFSTMPKNPLFNSENKPQSSNSIPFSNIGFKEPQAADSMDNLLGALGSKTGSGKAKPSSSFKSITPFSGSPSQNKPKPSFFIPEVKPQPQSQAPNFYGIPPVSGKSDDKKDKKKDKKDKKGKKQDVVICSNCGAILNSSYKFCNKCGSKL